MSNYITVTGNLARAIDIRTDENGKPYTFARIIVSDRIYDKKNDTWTDGPAIGYDFALFGNEALALAHAAQHGSIRLTVTGRYQVSEWEGNDGTKRIKHEIKNAEAAVSLTFQTVTVTRGTPDTAPAESSAPQQAQTADTNTPPADAWQQPDPWQH